MGNPTSYRGKGLTWRGKQLTGMSDTAHNLSAAYTYDSNGLRQQKTVNNVDTDYYYNGSVLIGLTRGDKTLRFSYDASGQVQAVDFNGTYYYCLRNGQGDIVKLIDGSETTVVEYTYDSWGKKLSCTGTLATTLGALNPFRYRGYVYDEETQWYYLRSRYYDPETCRFISADVLLSTGQGVIGHNCYVYCINNPVKYRDFFGTEAGDTFSTETEAIEDFYNCYAGKSKNESLEYLTFVRSKRNKNGQVVFYYDEVKIGEHDNCIFDFCVKYLDLMLMDEAPVIMVHTHPAPDDNTCCHYNKRKERWDYCDPVGLSGADKALLHLGRIKEVYAVLPDGRVYGAKCELFTIDEFSYTIEQTKKRGSGITNGGGNRICVNVNLQY